MLGSEIPELREAGRLPASE